jgi:hypothetical protein
MRCSAIHVHASVVKANLQRRKSIYRFPRLRKAFWWCIRWHRCKWVLQRGDLRSAAMQVWRTGRVKGHTYIDSHMHLSYSTVCALFVALHVLPQLRFQDTDWQTSPMPIKASSSLTRTKQRQYKKHNQTLPFGLAPATTFPSPWQGYSS